eukprot:411981_1
MNLWVWPSTTKICITTISLTILGVINHVYGIRFRYKLNSSPKISQKQKNDSLPICKILSQNTWCRFGVGGPKRKDRLEILITNIKTDNPDIICFQEMDILGIGLFLLCGDFLYIEKALFKLGYIFHSNPIKSTPFFGPSPGVVTFSKYPITDTQTYFFKNRAFAQPKGWQFVEIMTPNCRPIKIINLHIEHKQKAFQYKQIKELSNSNIWKKNEDSFRFCMGDFNICSNSKFKNKYKYLCAQMNEGLGLNVDLYSNVKRTWSPRKKRRGTRSLDHMFVNDTVKQAVEKCDLVDYQSKDVIASDHLGLLTTLKLI